MPRKLRCAAVAWKSPSSQGAPGIARRAAKCRQGSSHFQLSGQVQGSSSPCAKCSSVLGSAKKEAGTKGPTGTVCRLLAASLPVPSLPPFPARWNSTLQQ
ncbi:hypothetical protein CGCA056_v002165 [Colletotrichum aenigma]|uniref:uncharacterized protein n=1 Tax=Colletotrichum aenigma TaxID=1215731 RepID=UPI0018731643|nr:uncharacterized protein CGCA056_v002165 [Colletotrichum aenigma]KAF5525695.1 hypothetical protein CGCA056_v002165 [Colletotrichum aenigma]